MIARTLVIMIVLTNKIYTTMGAEDESLTFGARRFKRYSRLSCPKPNGIFPYAEDCSKFLNCANGRAYLQPCAPGTLFNWRLSICDFPYNVKCGSHLVAKTSAPYIKKVTKWQHSYKDKQNKFETKNTNKTKTSTKKGRERGQKKIDANVEDITEQPTTKAYQRYKKLKIDKHIRDVKKYRKLETEQPETLCLKPTGQFPYPKDCSKFVNCWKGRSVLQSCIPGTLFDASSGNCGWPYQVVCTTPAKPVITEKPRTEKLQIPSSGKLLRLHGGGAPYVGYVEIWSDNRWIAVVIENDKWDAKDELCQQLGFERGAQSESRGEVYGSRNINKRIEKAAVCAREDLKPSDCPVTLVTMETITMTIVGIRCQMNPVSECPRGWYRWGTKCYFADTSEQVNHAEARKKCIDRSARLLSLSSQEENDFISDLLASKSGSSSGFHTGGVFVSMHGIGYWIWEDSNIAHDSKLPYEKWWPGWSTKLKKSRKTKKKLTKKRLPKDEFSTECITLHNKFSDASDRNYSAEYFYWTLGDCEQSYAYVCEREPLPVGCITGRGESYHGTANITLSGTACKDWNTLGGAFRGLSRRKNLTRNYCSNPDGDDLPWCFVEKGISEFCDIPRCPASQVPITFEDEATATCSSWSFTCSTGDCIHQEWVCDGQRDCPDGEEEEGCPKYDDLFDKKSGQKLVKSAMEKWVFSPKSTCAIRCAQSKHFVCHSFNYEESTSTCILNKGNAGTVGGLEKDANWEYHERIDLAPDCSKSFICNDFLCLDSQLICDGHRDCKEGEDEHACIDVSQFKIRLVNGSSSNEGRVEIKIGSEWGQVCDDMWSLEDGHVACRQLGFPRGALKVFTNSKFGDGVGDYLMDDLNCRGDEKYLSHCDFGGWNRNDCEKSESAGVACYRDSDVCTPLQWQCKNGRCIQFAYYCDQINDCGDNSDEDIEVCRSPIELRLSGGNLQDEKKEGRSSIQENLKGRVEIRYKGVWGTLCDDDIKLKEGHVICRMLGWKGASSVHRNNTFGAGSGPIWLDGLQCLGKEESITDCRHEYWGKTNCDHTEDLSIACLNERLSEEDKEPEKIRIENQTTSETPTTPYSLFPRTCGISYVEDNPKAMLASPRIYDGQFTRAGAQPWMVGLRRKTPFGSTHECGAFILSEDLILTAAHCLWKYVVSEYLVRTGDYNNEKKDAFEEEWKVDKIAIHPQFDKGTLFNNDVGIIKIKRKAGRGISFNERVQPICLLTVDFPYPEGLNCTVAGWGTMSASSGYSRILQSTMLPILPDSLCRADHVYGATRISSGMFCAGYMEGGIDTCQGDSGGPLVCMVDDRYTAVGITSWGHGCARANKPGVYTKLSSYLTWIYNTTLTLEN